MASLRPRWQRRAIGPSTSGAGTTRWEIKVQARLLSEETVMPPSTDPMSLLVPTRTVRVFSEQETRTEADVDFELRPRPRNRYVPPTHGVIKQEKVGSGCIQGTQWMPTLSGNWRLRGESRFSTVGDNGAQLKMWDVQGLPELTIERVQTDVMSESESEDEGEDDVLIPTVDMCKGFFEQLAEKKMAAALEAEDEDPKAAAKGGKKGAEEEEVVVVAEPPPPPLSSFDRNNVILALEQQKLSMVEESAQLLPERLEAVRDRICSVRQAWALDGHGTAMPSHKQQF